MKKLLALLFTLTLHANSYSQEFEVPQDFELESAEDFRAHNDEILRAIDWMLNTPIDRKRVNGYFLQWLAGTPDVTVELQPSVVTFMEKSPELLMIFMAGWTDHALKSGKASDNYHGSLAGIETVITFYQANRQHLGKVKAVEKYIKMKEKGTLQEYVKENS